MRRAIFLIGVLFPAACGDDDGGEAPERDAGLASCETAAGSTPASGVMRIGEVESLELSETSIEAVVVAGTDWQFFDMAPQRQVESARAGDCVLYEWEPSFCETECTEGICHDGECKPSPQLISAGTMRVVADGTLIAVEADAPTFWGPIYHQLLPAPPSNGSEVTVCAGGEAAGGFGAALLAVAPLAGALPEDGIFELVDGGDQVVSWQGESDARVRLTLNADNQHHGLPYRAVLECDVADTGELVIPRALIESFPPVARPPENFACAGTDCPRSQLVRYRAARIDEPDLVMELRAERAVEFWIEH